MRISFGQWVTLCLMAYSPFLAAQTSETTQSPNDSRIERLEKRFDDMEKQHRAKLKLRDDEIARLKGQIDRRDATTKPVADHGMDDVLTKSIDRHGQGVGSDGEDADRRHQIKQCFR